MRSLKRIVAVGAVSVLTFLPALGASAEPVEASDNMLRLPINAAQIDSLNPFLAIFGEALDVLELEYLPMVTQTPPDRVIGAALASEWTADGETWTFTLRPDLKWSDGEPLTAEDVLWTYEQTMTNSKLSVANGASVANVESVSAPDKTTIVIVTKAETGVNPGTLPVVPQHIWSKIDKPEEHQNTSDVVGSGPFILSEYSRGASVVMESNPHYWDGKPSLDGVIFVNYQNTDAAVLALQSGEVDMVVDLGLEQYESLADVNGIERLQAPSQRYWSLVVNPGATTANNEPMGDGAEVLHDPVLRNALRQGLDTEMLVDKIIGGIGSTGVEIIPPGNVPYYSDYEDIATGYSPDEANKALDEAGYAMGADGYRTDKNGGEIDIELSFDASFSENSQTASFIQPWMKAIGIRMTLNPTNWDEMSTDLTTGNYDIFLDGWGVPADPDYMLYIMTCGVRPEAADGVGSSSMDNWCNPEFDKLYDEQHAEPDLDKRVALVHEALAIHYKAATNLILYYPDALDAYRSDRISGVIPMAGRVKNLWSIANIEVIGSSSSSEEINYVGWVIGIGAVLVVAGVGTFLLIRRKKTAADRE